MGDMATYRPRPAWTSTDAKGDALPASAVDEVDVHYPASGNVRLQGLSESQVASRLRGWRDFHVNTRGWSDIGYNMAVDGSGRIWTLRGLDRVGAHAASPSNPNQNRHSIGVLFVIGDHEQPTQACIQAFRQLRQDILKRSPKATLVRGHGYVPGAATACPGAPLLALIANGTLTDAPTPTPPEDDMTESEIIAAVQRAMNAASMRELVRELVADAIRDAVPYAVWGYKNPSFGEQDTYARLREIQGNVK